MLRRYLPLFGLVLLSLLPSSALAAGSLPLSFWEVTKGDAFVVDVSENVGYLVHENGEYTSFIVASGRKAVVHYIGRTYRADTPVREWTAEQLQIKGDRHTFGASGRFIRLYRDGENSPYGIHPYYKPDQWMEADGRYFSMGCILVTEEMMDIVQKTFEINDKHMRVITTTNVDETFAKLQSDEVAVNK